MGSPLPAPPWRADDDDRCRDRLIPAEPTAEEFGGEQELEQEAQAAAVRRAGIQAVETCGASQAATLQTGTACEDRDAEADGRVSSLSRHRYRSCKLRPSHQPFQV